MNKQKTIWIVCVNIQPPEYDTHLRHQKFADALIRRGYKVIIFAGSYLHYNKKNLITNSDKYIEEQYGDKQYVFIKTPSYTSNALKRMCSIFLFACRLFYYRNKFSKPDLILHNLRVPFDFPVYFAALKLKAAYLTEVWDLWPESFVAFGLMKRNNPFLKIAYQVEKFLYQKGKRIIFTMEGAKDYILEKKWDIGQGGKIDLEKYVYINNGVDLKDFDFNKEHYQIEDSDLKDTTFFKVVYLGSIRLVNDVKLLIDAAELLKEEKRIKFLIYGDGSEREVLEKYCREHRIDNVYFKEKWVEIKYVPYILSCSSLNILNYKKNSIDRYGGSQGKLFQYMASGKPICSNQIMGYDLIVIYGMGVAQNFESAEEYAETIKRMCYLPEGDYNKMCKAAREAARDFDYQVLSQKFCDVVDDVLK
ncbi:MAG: glycosyltransferase family 4 protein [Odoribacter sp.]